MHTRQLGETDLQLTAIGIGTWAIGGGDWKFGWGAQDEHEAVAGIVRGVDLGINWVDTAAVYGDGRSEQLVGQALKELGPARRPIVATKCGRIFQPDGNIKGVLRRESIVAECEASLRRLGVDMIDLYQMHWPDPDAGIEEGWSAMADLVRQGKVGHIGVSNYSVAQMRRVQSVHPVASLQPPYSMLSAEAERELLPYCGEQRIGVVAYSPMCKGLLTGAFTRERAASLGPDDHRSKDPKFAEPLLGIHLDLVEGLKPLARQHGRTVAELAIAWVLRRPEVTSAIVGARRPDQIEGTAAAGDWQLSDELIAQIEQLLAQHAEALSNLSGVERGRV
jgi:aryl-alcohol dehydrogenase-like predicted oxidoreductase